MSTIMDQWIDDFGTGFDVETYTEQQRVAIQTAANNPEQVAQPFVTKRIKGQDVTVYSNNEALRAWLQANFTEGALWFNATQARQPTEREAYADTLRARLVDDTIRGAIRSAMGRDDGVWSSDDNYHKGSNTEALSVDTVWKMLRTLSSVEPEYVRAVTERRHIVVHGRAMSDRYVRVIVKVLRATGCALTGLMMSGKADARVTESASENAPEVAYWRLYRNFMRKRPEWTEADPETGETRLKVSPADDAALVAVLETMYEVNAEALADWQGENFALNQKGRWVASRVDRVKPVRVPKDLKGTKWTGCTPEQLEAARERLRALQSDIDNRHDNHVYAYLKTK